MIPLRDSVPNVHRPYGVYLLIVLNGLVFLFQLALHKFQLAAFFHAFGVVPLRLLAETGDPVLVKSLPFLSYQFVHNGIMHFVLNMWSLWIFADNVEDVMGTGRFLFFYLLCGAAAAAGHIVFNAGSAVPVVGASGAIAGIMGAYLVLYPRGKVVTLIPIFIFPYIVEIPSVLFLSIWFAVQLFSGVAMAARGQEGGVAFMAHAAGFVSGILLLPLFKQAKRCYYCYEKSSRTYQRK